LTIRIKSSNRHEHAGDNEYKRKRKKIKEIKYKKKDKGRVPERTALMAIGAVDEIFIDIGGTILLGAKETC